MNNATSSSSKNKILVQNKVTKIIKTLKKSRRKRRQKSKNACFKLMKRNQKLYSKGFRYFDHNRKYLPFSGSKDFQEIDPNNYVKKMNTMSNWYWSNYQKALDWRKKHNEAYWRSCALSLYHENQNLWQMIKNLNINSTVHCVPNTKNFEKSISNRNIEKEHIVFDLTPKTSEDHEEVDCSSDVLLEMSEEMIQYFEESFKHKMELKKSKMEIDKEEDLDDEEIIKKAQNIKAQREREMKLLYGEGASMIVGMETAVQLSYEKYCDLKSPKYWPNIPLKL